MSTCRFSIGTVLTGTTGKMLCERDFGQFHEMVEYMTSGPVWTHELVALADIIKAELLRQHPDLPTDAGAVTPENFAEFTASAVAELGADRAVSPIPDYTRTKGPLTSLAEIMGSNP